MRGPEAASLATQFCITAKAVRDVWNLRTWAKTTMPFWTQADLNTRLCKECRSRKIRSLPDACETCSKLPTRGRPRIQRTKLWLDTAAKVRQKDVLQVSQKVEEKLEQAEAGAGATLSEGHSKISIDECCYVRPDPKVCVAVQDVLDGMCLAHTSEVHQGTGCSIGAPLFFSALDDDEGEVPQLTCEETPATIDAEECHKEEDACWETCAEMLFRQRTVPALDIGDLFLQSNDNENDVIAFCGTEHDEGAAVGATCQTRKLSHHQTLLACDDGDGMLPYNEEQEIIL